MVVKANDLVVAKRQEHDRMAWSKEGSEGLASSLISLSYGENRGPGHDSIQANSVSGSGSIAAVSNCTGGKDFHVIQC
jgi:hypothetical protein